MICCDSNKADRLVDTYRVWVKNDLIIFSQESLAIFIQTKIKAVSNIVPKCGVGRICSKKISFHTIH